MPEQLLKEFEDVFSSTKKLTWTANIKLKENYVSQVAACHKISLVLHNKEKQELNNMVEVGIITKAGKSTKWKQHNCSSFSKKLRTCLDTRLLNRVI